MKVLALTRYDRRGASSRLRTLQFLPGLKDQGIDVAARPLLDARFLERRYEKRGVDLAALAAAYASRAKETLVPGGWDLIWIEKEVFPWLPYVFERALVRVRAPYVVDFDDAWFHRYDRHRRRAIRVLLGDKLNRVMRGAACVIAGNDYIADHARSVGAHRVAVVPTVVDTRRYAVPERTAPREGTFTVGWIGTPMTARYLEPLGASLRDLAASGPMRFVAVGAGPLDLPGVPLETPAWSEESEASQIASFDVGVMPLPDSPWERGKCGYKLIQCMAAGKPVVASPVGVNARLVRDGENGYLASDPAAWTQALARLRADASTRTAMGAAGRRLVEERYSLDAVLPALAAILREAAGR